MRKGVFCILLVTLVSCGSSPKDPITHTHKYVVETGTDATCLEGGISCKIYCEECGFVFIDHHDTKPLGHKVAVAKQSDPGYIFPGHEEYTYCSRCGEVLSGDGTPKYLYNRDDISSVTTADGTTDFTLTIGKNNTPYRVSIDVSYLDNKEHFSLNNDNLFSYSNMLPNTVYNFVFSVFYEDGDKEEPLVVNRYINTEETSLPTVNITTKDYVWPSVRNVEAPKDCWGMGIADNNYVKCNTKLINHGDVVYDSSVNSDGGYGSKIKRRGNSSGRISKRWLKRPYKIKLNEEIDLLQNFIDDKGKNRKSDEWLLLSTNTLQNEVGFALNSLISGENKIQGMFVNLELNGDYRGVFYLCESISKGNGSGNHQSRICIDNDGYIVENDTYWWNEDIFFSTNIINWVTRYTFKYPSESNLSEKRINYINNYINDFETALLEEDDSYLGYIDVSSFVSWLMTHDILGTDDFAGSNMYITKKNSKNSKLKMGPCWDFDTNFHVGSEQSIPIRDTFIFYYPMLLEKVSFLEEYDIIFNSVKNTLSADLVSYLNSLDKEAIDHDNCLDAVRWGVENVECDDYINTSKAYIDARIEWLASN